MSTATLDLVTRAVTQFDLPAIRALNHRVFGPGCYAKAAYRVREGGPDISRFCRLAEDGCGLIASLRMTEILIGGTPGALLLGPLAVDARHANRGHGRRLIGESVAAARDAGFRIVLLVGDVAYYSRLGFVVIREGKITMPGPVDPKRLMALEIECGALDDFQGAVVAAHRREA